ncbi:hypothetical protein [Sphingomonas daechungensis]|uniref:hypothetical protein n=1 Tax=Sphingomonas daechungensis TaxID=1176646 RepID=UPI003783F2AE
MSTELAVQLYRSGRAHAAASCLLYRAAVEYAKTTDEIKVDPLDYAFNGTYSLSIHYLLGLGLELLMKAIIAACDAEVDEKYLKTEVGHDLVKALDEAEQRGFKSEAEHLREMAELLRDPYMQHWLRYKQPPQMPLPGDFDQVVKLLEIFDSEVAAMLTSAEGGEAKVSS